ncbi:MAG: TerC family protein [Gammaproteobacteria bacterium]|jgi:predicted tellurium resistance membrane protein TerC|nr:TerC family protein [Gammaproteobacteria bacterium]
MFLDPNAWAALITLTALEIVLGIDNIIFLSILVSKLPPAQQPLARTLGLSFAMATRIALLLSITWVMRLTTPLFEILGHTVSGRDLILFFGGLFLIAKSTIEIHSSLEGPEEPGLTRAAASFVGIVLQIGIIDIVFSLDSVITAVGLAQDVAVMVIAIVLAVFVMMIAAKAVGDFVDRHPTVKMLALSFLILIGVALVGESAGLHIPKGYIYFAMAFSVLVEMLNIQLRRRTAAPVRLHGHVPVGEDAGSGARE